MGMKLDILYLVNLIHYINETVTLNNVNCSLKMTPKTMVFNNYMILTILVFVTLTG